MSEKELDPAALKKIGVIQQKQKEYFALRLRVVGGDLSSSQLEKIGETARKYAKGRVHLSVRQGVEIHFVRYSDVENARKELESAGLRMGACGPRVRGVVACPGSATCRWGIADAQKIASDLDAQYFGVEAPHKFKIAVTGCPNNCAKAAENDLGIMGALLPRWSVSRCTDCGLCVNICPTKAIEKRNGTDGKPEYVLREDLCINCSICTASCPANSWVIEKQGYNIFVGGTMGKTQRLGILLKKLVSDKDLPVLVERILVYYQKNGRKKERLGNTLERIGFDSAKKELLDGI
ncbi:MAG: 4Fe-4S dicluster domain-containing protein [Endomicrobiales bacterium]|jgi:dissimilatory sulfite reductase (desulfoviridin) alpha/beta subunit